MILDLLAALLLAAPVLQPVAQDGNDADASNAAPVAGNRPQDVQNQARPAPRAATRTGQDGSTRTVGGGSGEDNMPQMFDEGETFILMFDEAGDGPSLEALTRLCQQATGINFYYDKQTGEVLKSTNVKIYGTKRIPKKEFYAFYQILMFVSQFQCIEVGPEHLSVVVIQALQQNARQPSNLASEAIYVQPEELERYANQVATKIMTVLHLPHTDVRQLGNSLRVLSTDTANNGVVPVGNTNSVILQGFASSVVSLARILQLVDRESARDTSIPPVFEVIPMEFAAAQDLADVIEQLLEASRRQLEKERGQNPQGVTGQIRSAGGETKLMVYAPTNSLLVVALPDDMQHIKQLVAKLDVAIMEPEHTYHVYPLENVNAEELAEVLEEFLQDAQRVQGGAGGGNRPQPGGNAPVGASASDTETVVVPDPATNSLLIAAGKTAYEEVRELIRKLDRRQDQVLIETALIELTGSDFRDLGVELGLVDLPNGGETTGFGVSSFGLSQLQDTDGDGIFDIRVPSATSGITAGLLDGDDFALPFLISALKDVRDSNVLNVPSVLVNNNGSATVSSIDEQPTTTISQQTTGGQQESFAGYEKAGITLQISPSISASGYLRLNVYLEVSTFQGTFSGPIPPPRLTRTISSSFNVPDGDTMVIGGLITDNQTHRRRSVPWFGELPVVGALFRRDEDTNSRITLYFFVTPHVLRDRDFADLSEISFRKKLEAADSIGVERIKRVDPEFKQVGEAIDFGGFDIPIYKGAEAGEVDPEEVGLDPERRAELLTPPQPDGSGSSAEPAAAPLPAPPPSNEPTPV